MFTVIDIDDHINDMETMGKKQKFWITHNDYGMCLFKFARLSTGEDWSEKIVAELCKLLRLPHAEYELARCKGLPGTISKHLGHITTGDEVLQEVILDYPRDRSVKYGVKQHTIDAVFAVIERLNMQLPFGWQPISGIETAADVFVGYLLLDAWIGNTDRHHQNWGYIIKNDEGRETRYLSPTYDHASSLGRELLDQNKQERLQTSPTNNVSAYVGKARSALYLTVKDTKPLKTFDVYAEVTRRYRKPSKVWLTQLAGVSTSQTRALLMRIPNDRISTISLEFAQEVLRLNRNRLLDLLPCYLG